uniref:amino-acid N-acetyltransferase n=1 Tax=Odontella aurita TaxID=265563 RepID=A0A7S4N0L1_9STRA
MFRGSAQYIANHRNTLVVYHVPGELLEWGGFSDLMDDIALTWLLGMKIVLVCGCRHQIDRRMEEATAAADPGGDGAGYDPVRRSSVRVTDADTLRVVKEEAGYVRFEVERQLARALRQHGSPRAISSGDGIDGNVVSGNFYSAQPFGVIDGVDYMYTGFPRRVEVEKIRNVHNSNDIVLLTPLGVSPSGEIFNVNSESLAANVAGNLGASKVIYFAVRGTALVKRDSSKIVQNLRLSDARNLLQHYRVRIHKRGFASVDDRGIEDVDTSSGDGDNGDGDADMVNVEKSSSPSQHNPHDALKHARSTPAVTESLLKIGWATSALERGVKRAHILAPTNGALLQELYTRDGSGILISRDLYEGIRPADVNDVAGIYDLIDPLVRMGTLVPRPRSVMEKDINSYYVYTRDDLIVATGQLKRFEGGYAEIGCLVVSRDYRSQGRGDAMLGYLERLCLQCGASKVFVLSTQTMEWFVERGFREVNVDALPPSRRAVYNYSRRSKIYMKKIDGDRDLDAAELWWNR